MTSDALEPFSAPIDPETGRILTAIDEQRAKEATSVPESAASFRQQHRDNARRQPPDPEAVDRRIEGPAGPVALRIFVPEEVRGAYLYMHSGGWVIGGADLQDEMLRARAEALGTVIVSVDYRLAPDHRYPAAPDDCEAAALWLVEQAAQEFGIASFVIGGESAGAHLSVVTLLRLRDRHGLTPFAAADLRYGLYDLRCTPSVRHADGKPLDLGIVTWCIDHFVDPHLREDPDVSPLFARLHGMPPARFTIGTHDSLVDDSLFLWARWRAAGNHAELGAYAGGTHDFDRMPIPVAEAANDAVTTFIRRFLVA